MDDIYDITKPFPPKPGTVPGQYDPTQQQPQGNRLDVPPAMLAAWLGTYGDQMELSALEKQQAQAEALRDMKSPEGRDTGRVYVAANPLEHIGSGLQRFAGMRDAKAAAEAAAGIRKDIKKNVGDIGAEYLKK